jgi:signal peptidase I
VTAARLAGHAATAGILLLAVAVALLTIGPRLLGYQALPVLTGSMSPAIPTGSLVVVTQVAASEVGVGDVITFHHPQRPQEYVTHRVVAVEQSPAGRALTTKGDANAQPDAWKVVATESGYRMAFGLPYVGGAIIAFASSPARLLLYVVPMIVLAVLALVRIWRQEQETEPATPPVLEPVATGGD